MSVNPEHRLAEGLDRGRYTSLAVEFNNVPQFLLCAAQS